jgi:hypothetical protein
MLALITNKSYNAIFKLNGIIMSSPEKKLKSPIAIAFVPKICEASDSNLLQDVEAFLTIFKGCVRKKAVFAKIPLNEAFVVLEEKDLSDCNIGLIVYIYRNQSGRGCRLKRLTVPTNAINAELSQGTGSNIVEADCIISYHYEQRVIKGPETTEFINKLIKVLRHRSFNLKQYEQPFFSIDMQILGLFTSVVGIAIVAITFTAFGALALPGIMAGTALTVIGLGLFAKSWSSSNDAPPSMEANLESNV